MIPNLFVLFKSATTALEVHSIATEAVKTKAYVLIDLISVLKVRTSRSFSFFLRKKAAIVYMMHQIRSGHWSFSRFKALQKLIAALITDHMNKKMAVVIILRLRCLNVISSYSNIIDQVKCNHCKMMTEAHNDSARKLPKYIERYMYDSMNSSE